MTTHRTRGVLLSTVVALLLTGCSGGSTSSSRDSSSPSPGDSSASAPSSAPSSAGGKASLQQYYGQQLTWTPCEGTFTCARLRVPLDYAKPRGRSIKVRVLKVAASDKSQRLGSMVFDPGGPGESGADYVTHASSAFGTPLLEHYDIIGLDPRGVGQSTPLDCLPDRQLDTVLTSDPAPDTRAETRQADQLLRDFGRGCFKRSGALAAHISTVEVAKDLDVLRAALGEKKLTYFGASYGTDIGSTYAGLFPKKVGRMVLDGALDPRSSTLGINLRQAQGFETALRAYVGACVDRGDCFLGSSVDQGTRRVKAFLDQVEKQPLPAGGQRRLNVGNASYGISAALYSKQSWSVLDAALEKALAGDGTILMLLADSYLHRNADGTYKDSLFEAFYAINCLDHDDAIASSTLKRYDARFDKASPTFGRSFLYSVSACEHWPVHTGRGAQTVHAKGAAPIVVVGTTRDPATPLVWAQSLAKQLDSGVLVTRDGDGHTGYRQGSACTDTAIESYLVAGKVPKDGLRCS